MKHVFASRSHHGVKVTLPCAETDLAWGEMFTGPLPGAKPFLHRWGKMLPEVQDSASSSTTGSAHALGFMSRWLRFSGVRKPLGGTLRCKRVDPTLELHDKIPHVLQV